ncbi:MAG: hypothetical protein ACE5HI_00180 [bacterium]
MKGSAFNEWLQNSFDSLPRCKEDFFLKLWHNGKMRYTGTCDELDTIDELSARLVCAALHNGRQILIILPDSKQQRGAVLFASTLIMSSVDAIKANRQGGCVLFFGSKLGIRSHLPNISIQRLNLSHVFSQTYGRREISESTASVGRLPHVFCIYSPLDPSALVSFYSPRWVAIDCDDSTRIPWINQLLPYLKKNNIPLIAWSSNPLSSIRKDFESVGATIFKWPTATIQTGLPFTKKSNLPDVLNVLSKSSDVTAKIAPCLINGDTTNELSEHLKKAQQALAAGMAKKPGRFGQDALSTGWRYLRSLERVVIPVDLFDVEAVRYWGVIPISRLKNGFEKFITSDPISTSNICEQLETAKYHLDSVDNTFRNSDPPRWNSSIELCLEDVPKGHVRILVFPSDAQKTMFAFALLSRINTSESDLSDMSILLMSFKDAVSELNNGFNTFLSSDLIWDVIHIALPNHTLTEKMTPFFGLVKFEVLVYPHQLKSLSYQVSNWGNLLSPDITTVVTSLSTLANVEKPDMLPEKKCIYRMGDTRIVAGKPISKELKRNEPIWKPKSEEDEVAYIFTNEEDGPTDDLIFTEEEEQVGKETVVDRALEINFESGWTGLFALESRINVVQSTSQGDTFESRYVKSLRKGDRIIYIYGQKRQSLYDLILSRVHHHPSIEIHLALIRRWQDEIHQAYAIWLQHGKTLYELFREMKKLNSKLETELTLNFWVTGCTLRPRDREDLRRVSEVLKMPFTSKYYKKIHSAGDRISGLHISLSRRLNAWIQSGATITGITDDLIDEATGLTFGDVSDSLILLKVESSTEVSGPFDKSSLGKIERKITNE